MTHPATTTKRWTPHVTVATVLERRHNQHKEYLLVRENVNGCIVYNQPAGHLEEGESLIDAAVRETLEETGWQVEISAYLGMYRYIAPNEVTYLRHGFAAKAKYALADHRLDEGILEAVWLSYADIVKKERDMRSPLVKQLIDDYETGVHYPLAVFRELL